MLRVLLLLFAAILLLPCDTICAREWTDRTGKFSVEAELLEVSAERVVLKRTDGRTLSVPIERLSEADRRYLASQGTKVAGLNSVEERTEHDGEDATEVPSRVATQAVLGKPTSFHFTNVSLVEALDEIASQHRIAVHLERGALEAAGLTDTASVSGEANQEPLDKSLETLLGKLNLIAMVADDVLLVTTADKGASRLELKVYRFLPPMPAQSGVEHPLDAFFEKMSTEIAPESWYEYGGPGGFWYWGTEGPLQVRVATALIVDQTPHVHREIQKRHAGRLSLVPTARWKDSPLQKAVHQETAKRLRRLAVCEFSNTPVSEVARNLSERYEIPVAIDLDAAGRIGVSADRRIRIDLRGIPLESILTLMLRDLDLDWSLNQDGVRITTRERAQQRVEMLKVEYDLGSLMGPVKDREFFLRMISLGVEPLSWNRLNKRATGEITWIANSTVLRIHNTYRVQRKIELLLGTIKSINDQH